MSLTQASLKKLEGVHPRLVAIIKAADEAGPMTFQVTEGVRSLARQKALVKQGASRTLRSRHIPGPNGLGHAVDLVVLVNGRVSWEAPLYHRLADQVKAAARKLGISVEWGGDWRGFFDGPHFQLPWGEYPGTTKVSDPAPERPGDGDMQTLVPGSAGVEVRALQDLANKLGAALAVDGDYGPATRRVILALTEKVAGKATDIVTPAVLDKLAKAARKAVRDA